MDLLKVSFHLCERLPDRRRDEEFESDPDQLLRSSSSLREQQEASQLTNFSRRDSLAHRRLRSMTGSAMTYLCLQRVLFTSLERRARSEGARRAL